MNVNAHFVDILKYKYADFTGRASRSEYWTFTLFKWLLLFFIMQLSAIGGGQSILAKVGGATSTICFLAFIIPSLAVSVRRLHDTGKSGWWLLFGIIPVLGSLVIFIFNIMASDIGPNKYGNNPHEISNNITDHLV